MNTGGGRAENYKSNLHAASGIQLAHRGSSGRRSIDTQLACAWYCRTYYYCFDVGSRRTTKTKKNKGAPKTKITRHKHTHPTSAFCRNTHVVES